MKDIITAKKITTVKRERIKNIPKSEVVALRDQVAYQEGQVVSRTLAQNPAVSVTLFSFDKGEEISSHKSAATRLSPALTASGRSRLTMRSISSVRASR